MNEPSSKPHFFPSEPGEVLGWVSGWVVAPLFALVSFARSARTFHPRGSTLRATVRPHPAVPPELRALAQRWTGRALVRFSGALWKRAESVPDILGCAVRLVSGVGDPAHPAAGDQDLLFATVRRPWTLPFAPLTTRVRDYLQNDYYAVSPFDVGEEEPVYLRLHPWRVPAGRSGRRSERLLQAVKQGSVLEVGVSRKPGGAYTPVVEIGLEGPASVDEEALHFSPFRDGRDVRPHGFIHALRRAVYSASQRGRSARESHT